MINAPLRILFVCMGNICRSPTAEGVFRAQVKAAGLSDRITTDSAGTHGYHIGDPPDPRSIKAAVARGIDISDLRARMVRFDDFERFDLVLAMDRQNHEALTTLYKSEMPERLRMFMEFAPELRRSEVPDPYYGGAAGFDHVLDLCEAASRGLLTHLKAKL